MIDAGVGQQLDLLLQVGEQQRSRLRPHDHGRVTVERHHRGRQALALGSLPYLGDDATVSEVDAVVGADRDGAALLGAGTPP